MKKIASWDECVKNNNSLKTSIDEQKAKSLFETAQERMTFFKKLKLDKSNCRFIFEGYYASALEIIHAIIILKGYKVDNHICLGYYLRDELKREELYRLFDDSRFKRNSIVYYGKKLDFEIAVQSISKLKLLIDEIKKILKKK